MPTRSQQGIRPLVATGVDLARNFNGTSDYIDCGTPIAPAGDFTWTAWVQLTSLSGNAIIITQGDPGSNWNFIQYVTSSGVLRVTVDGSSSFVNGSTVLSASTWYHMALTYNSGTQKTAIYINGVLDGTLSGTTVPVFINNTDLTIGAAIQHTGNFWPGPMTDIAMFNVLLNGTQLTNLAAGRRANNIGASANLQRYYPILGQSPEPDKSGNGFNGVLTGTTVVAGPPTLDPFVAAPVWQGPTSTLTHRWQMDSGSISSGVVHDLVGSLDATIVGSPTNVSSPSGAFASTGLSFNGSTDSLSLASTPVTLFKGPYTIAFWVNLPDITFQPDGGGGFDPRFLCLNDGAGNASLGNDSGGGNNGFLIACSTGTPGQQSILGNSASLSNNTWAHVTYTVNDTTQVLYVNGSSIAVTGGATDLTSGVAGYTIAERPDGLRHTKGAFYQLVTYSSVLSPTDVTTLYNAK